MPIEELIDNDNLKREFLSNLSISHTEESFESFINLHVEINVVPTPLIFIS